MVKNVFKKKKNAFSLVEALIMITVLAIAVASITPIITRKIINNSDIGATLGGGSHGRYEIYSKEILIFGPNRSKENNDNGYEKIFDASQKGDIIVYQKKNDKEYTDIVGSQPSVVGNNKSTLYEEITDATPIKDEDGNVTRVKIKINGKEEIVKQDSRYIFDIPQLSYIEGSIKKEDGTLTFIPDSGEKKLDRTKNRIIEGNLTEKYHKNNPETNNSLWYIGASSNNFDGDVVAIPWEKVISGSKEIVDRPIKKDDNGNYIGQFTPSETAVNVVLHAVGGGGAGGGPDESALDANVNPKTADSNQIAIMKKQLANRFRQVAKKKGLSSLASLSDNDIVKVTYKSNIGQANNPSELSNSSTYILLNASNGTITVKFDVRSGMILPHELLDYTKVLGAQTQTAEIHDMPKWFDWQYVTNGGFKAGAVACGGKGGDAGDLIVKTNDSSGDDALLRRHFTDFKTRCYYETCTYTVNEKKEICNPDLLAKYGYDTNECVTVNKPVTKSTEYRYECYCECIENSYYTCPSTTYSTSGACYSDGYKNASENVCPSSSARTRTSDYFTHKFLGGSGGAAPKCVWLSRTVNGPVNVSTTCLGAGFSGASGSNKTHTKSSGIDTITVSNINGESGKTCSVNVDGSEAISVGGTGGVACVQSILTNTETGYEQNNSGELAREVAFCKAQYDGITSTWCDKYDYLTSTTAMKYVIDSIFLRKTVPGGSYYCGKNGKTGQTEFGNIASGVYKGEGAPPTNSFGSGGYGIGSSTGLYNHIYTWTIPYSSNYLGYGEAGSAGEYSTTKLSKIDGSLFIKLGKGGVWSNDTWQNGKKGPDGTDTIVKMGKDSSTAKKVLVAKGGQGGRGKLKTDNYDLCYANDRNKACSDNENVVCCDGTVRNSREVSATNVRYSLFDTIKSFAGNSKIIGIGLGRGAQGAGTTENEIEVFGSRFAINASAASSFDSKVSERIVYKKASPQSSTGTPEETNPSSVTSDKYKNKYLKPANINFKGGDGAVIITW